MVKFDPALHVRTMSEVQSAHMIFARQNNCDPCPVKPTCQGVTCPSGQGCIFTIRDCETCAKGVCVDNDDSLSGNTTPTVSKGPNTGAIAGGVVGGVVAIAIITYLVWRFCIKTKRERTIQEAYDGDLSQGSEGEKDIAVRHAHRSSVHTVHSIASTVLTRASNIIQIAYIPGVTNRATPNSPSVLVPPVPPIPIHASSNPNSPSYEEQHFFTPGDLRNSTYSGLSGESDRGSFARTSYAPRSSIAPSIASTIYGKNAVVVAPAQTGMRAKAAMVSVKSMGGNSSGDESIPAVPTIDYEKFENPAKSRDSTFSVGSTFLNNANTATVTQSRAQVIRVGSGAQVKQISVGSAKSAASTPALGSPSRMTPTASVASMNVRDSDAPTIIEDSPSMDQGPFSDPPRSSGTNQSTKSSASSLSAVIEEATRRAASGPDRKSKRQSESTQRATSPFSDEHATKE
ncbi:hypothetical protein F5X68DRAFT_186100 [Plectosphaerella plurivora]|uniref:Membrane anchor Opy2 N-terminal domain-containing protein n=1 Tax=Plectosphaerella plurivora TaxID=936078 RepID=A0A9P9AI75_9PEZI|nr:hypothetical protein F5X68DRAFT_186100 [Plectosphaerella plurivora]